MPASTSGRSGSVHSKAVLGAVRYGIPGSLEARGYRVRCASTGLPVEPMKRLVQSDSGSLRRPGQGESGRPPAKDDSNSRLLIYALTLSGSMFVVFAGAVFASPVSWSVKLGLAWLIFGAALSKVVLANGLFWGMLCCDRFTEANLEVQRKVRRGAERRLARARKRRHGIALSARDASLEKAERVKLNLVVSRRRPRRKRLRSLQSRLDLTRPDLGPRP